MFSFTEPFYCYANIQNVLYHFNKNKVEIKSCSNIDNECISSCITKRVELLSKFEWICKIQQIYE
ncbi:hypothetical protein T05_8924 [Trichinella murrelli]|uniref:Uncharacterized protein n=1 Tax=Trichinella murrelli TaxID=144512 RepID=A0A0V0U8E9_9BILA|nr:hypothetical protein T05_8924 [Trichinella murrelli]